MHTFEQVIFIIDKHIKQIQSESRNETNTSIRSYNLCHAIPSCDKCRTTMLSVRNGAWTFSVPIN